MIFLYFEDYALGCEFRENKQTNTQKPIVKIRRKNKEESYKVSENENNF